jgi:hypothetical protein
MSKVTSLEAAHWGESLGDSTCVFYKAFEQAKNPQQMHIMLKSKEFLSTDPDYVLM